MSSKLSEQNLFIAGPVGQLEALSTFSETLADKSQAAIICHPHPLHGGTMHNKVVHILAKSFEMLNIPTLRFNYRGVGQSEGTYAQAIGETKDCLMVYDWLVNQLEPNPRIYLAGFSFGSYISLQASLLRPSSGLISIAPPVKSFNFENASHVEVPWLIIQGEADEVVYPQDVYDFIEHLNSDCKLIKMPETSHFFHGKLIDLRTILLNNIKALML